MNTELLSTIGLCKRAGMLAVGEEPVESVARGRDARLLLLACDAGETTARRAVHFADIGQCLWIRVPFTKEQLGRAVGRGSCAILAVTDIGFASSITRRLAASDPDTYGQTAERLEIKAQRAAQRKTEEAMHEKNLRRGKKRTPAEPKIAEKPLRTEKKPFAGKPSRTEKKPFTGNSNRTEKKPYAGNSNRTERKPYAGNSNRTERKPYAGDSNRTERKPYAGNSNRTERKPYAGNSNRTERKPYAGNSNRTERKPYAGNSNWTEKKPYAGKPGERTHTSGGRASAPSGAKPYQKRGTGKFGSGSRPKPFGKPANPFAHSHPVKKGKGSFPKKEG